MKKALLPFVLLLFTLSTYSQTSTSVQLNSIELDETNETVRVSIKTTESFIIGANRYVLHIGSRHFLRNIHPEGRLDEIVFLLTPEQYKSLKADSRIILVYGLYHENTLQDNEGKQVNGFTGKHWVLGKFTPKELKNQND